MKRKRAICASILTIFVTSGLVMTLKCSHCRFVCMADRWMLISSRYLTIHTFAACFSSFGNWWEISRELRDVVSNRSPLTQRSCVSRAWQDGKLCFVIRKDFGVKVSLCTGNTGAALIVKFSERSNEQTECVLRRPSLGSLADRPKFYSVIKHNDQPCSNYNIWPVYQR